MMDKTSRRRVIFELLAQGPLASQEDMQRALKKRGHKVGQATLSRDVRELKLVKTANGYIVGQNGESSNHSLPPTSRLVREFVLSVAAAQNLLVVKTSVGSAQPVAAALDAENWKESVGTIAGDDVILIICPDQKAAKTLASRIEEMLR
jgi:transcriptional regulator of arginine metabolism